LDVSIDKVIDFYIHCIFPESRKIVFKVTQLLSRW